MKHVVLIASMLAFTLSSWAADVASYITSDNAIYIEDETVRAGVSVTLPVKMKNKKPATGYEFTLALPSSIDASSAVLKKSKARKEDEVSFSSAVQADGTIKAVCYTSDGLSFEGNDGEVATLTMTIPAEMTVGEYQLVISNIEISNNGQPVLVSEQFVTTLTVEANQIGGICGKNGGDNLRWTLSDEGILTITGSGAMEDYSDEETAPWHDYLTDIHYLELPDGMTTVGSFAFTECSQIASVTIPSTVTSIGDCALKGCSALMAVGMPETVTSLGDGVFWGCSSLAAMKVPDTITAISDGMFYGCTKLMAVQLPASLNSVGEYAFMFCSGLTSLTLPATLTKLDNYSFYGCSGLTSVTFPEGVTTIGTAAFNSCTNLATVTIPGSVTSLGQGAFASSQQLKEVYISRTKPLTYKNFFYGCDLKSATLYVPNGATAAYKAATGWKDFGTIIPLELDETGLRYDVDGDGAVDIADVTTVVNYIKTHQDLEVKE